MGYCLIWTVHGFGQSISKKSNKWIMFFSWSKITLHGFMHMPYIVTKKTNRIHPKKIAQTFLLHTLYYTPSNLI